MDVPAAVEQVRRDGRETCSDGRPSSSRRPSFVGVQRTQRHCTVSARDTAAGGRAWASAPAGRQRSRSQTPLVRFAVWICCTTSSGLVLRIYKSFSHQVHNPFNVHGQNQWSLSFMQRPRFDQCRINANRGPWQLFARGPLLTRDKMSKTNLNCR